jgi:hypothetical protein
MANRTDSSLLWSLPPKNITTIMDRPLFKGPKPLAGREQVVASSAGGWKISYSEIPVYGAGNYNYTNDSGSKIQLYRQAMNICIGNGLPTLVSPVIGPLSLKNRYNLGTTSPTDCSLSGAHTKGAMSITFVNSTIAPLRFGDYFELNGRLHVITTITGSTATIWPPLRANYSSGQLLEIADPRCLCYIEADSQANSITFQLGQIALWNVDFIEASW